MPSTWFSDTDPAALQFFIDLHRKMEPGRRLARVFERRLARVFELCDFQRSLQMANVRAMYPEAGDREVFLRTAARSLGRDLMIQVYGWDPDLHA